MATSRKMSITTGRWSGGEVVGGKTSESLVGKRTVKGGQAGRQRSPWSMDSYHHRAQILSTAFQIPLMIARPRCQLTPPTHRLASINRTFGIFSALPVVIGGTKLPGRSCRELGCLEALLDERRIRFQETVAASTHHALGPSCSCIQLIEISGVSASLG